MRVPSEQLGLESASASSTWSAGERRGCLGCWAGWGAGPAVTGVRSEPVEAAGAAAGAWLCQGRPGVNPVLYVATEFLLQTEVLELVCVVLAVIGAASARACIVVLVVPGLHCASRCLVLPGLRVLG
mmetsp:Transcript_113347/g.354513  ORF Transcript_113347/g.354513 Transcript_113347/m.354513 type:complete len:127 (+) Transcript_113347:307-687(+)